MHVKLSGMYLECPPGAEPDHLCTPWLRAALDIFGADRALVGSDWPVSAVIPRPVPYDRWFRLVLDGLGLSEHERSRIARGTAAEVWRLSAPRPAPPQTRRA